jgi:hypothetical protein
MDGDIGRWTVKLFYVQFVPVVRLIAWALTWYWGVAELSWTELSQSLGALVSRGDFASD